MTGRHVCLCPPGVALATPAPAPTAHRTEPEAALEVRQIEPSIFLLVTASSLCPSASMPRRKLHFGPFGVRNPSFFVRPTPFA